MSDARFLLRPGPHRGGCSSGPKVKRASGWPCYRGRMTALAAFDALRRRLSHGHGNTGRRGGSSHPEESYAMSVPEGLGLSVLLGFVCAAVSALLFLGRNAVPERYLAFQRRHRFVRNLIRSQG